MGSPCPRRAPRVGYCPVYKISFADGSKRMLAKNGRLLSALGDGMRCLAVLLCCLLCLENIPRALSQEAPPAPKLNIVIVDGEGAINNIRQRTAREPIIQVEDENHRPVAGAAVIFTLPSHGASGVFADGSQMFTTVTDAQGRAVAIGLKPNQVAGRLQIRVNASYQGRTGSTTITQRNTAAGNATSGMTSTKVLILVAIGAAVIAGIACAAACGGGSTASSPGTTTAPGTVITPGGGTVGPPH
jgi:hypothetical protein